jgi:hypothetical protein
MSGGHFDYYQYHIDDIGDKLEKSLADIEYAKEIGTVKKKEVYGYLLSVDGKKYWPNWLLDVLHRHDNREDVIKHLVDFHYIYNKDGKIYYDDGNTYEVVVYDGEREEWADGDWHLEIEDQDVVDEFKKGLKILRTAAIYAQRIDWFLSGDDGEESFKRRLKEDLDKLENKPLVDYEYWKQVFKERD